MPRRYRFDSCPLSDPSSISILSLGLVRAPSCGKVQGLPPPAIQVSLPPNLRSLIRTAYWFLYFSNTFVQARTNPASARLQAMRNARPKVAALSTRVEGSLKTEYRWWRRHFPTVSARARHVCAFAARRRESRLTNRSSPIAPAKCHTCQVISRVSHRK